MFCWLQSCSRCSSAMQWSFFCSCAPGWRLGVQLLVTGAVSLLSNPSDNCLGSWAAGDTILNLAQSLLLAGFSWMLQMWVREGQQICVCGTLHSLLSSSLWLHALAHALVVMCGLCMTKSASMWTWGCWVGGTCPSTRAVGCATPAGCVLPPGWVQMTQEGCGIWSPRASEELKDHRCCFLDHRLRHCWWYGSQPAVQGGKMGQKFPGLAEKGLLRKEMRDWWYGEVALWFLTVVCKRWQCWKELNCMWLWRT